jgi:hypothetical protein
MNFHFESWESWNVLDLQVLQNLNLKLEPKKNLYPKPFH